MLRKLLITIAALAVIGVVVVGAGSLLEPATGVHALTAESPCPTTACASGECHGFDNVPLPDGVYEMACPEASCASTECHAWDTLVGGYRQASDASLTLWLVVPVVVVVALVAVAKGGERRHG